ncbi:MAG: GTP pyrophosphokinase family protein [Lachnospiraceae bacterium]|nr:GTP pyrophosphokinase family protein [Lachnospiraceae bacterium]MBR4208678.1 GTP pyrophosphokinase family protein [Lachnospiraceae bacterium]
MELQLWRDTLMPYELAVEEILVKFNHLIREYRQSGQYSPIEKVQGRVKAVTSILAKAARKNIDLDHITEEIDDLAGIRITCQFVEDIDKVVEIIRGRADMEVASEVDYVHNVKPSGYRSYHMNVWYEVSTIYGKKRLQVEIQIRTMAMDFWATVEHSLRYKYPSELPKTTAKKLETAARALYMLDNVMSDIREEVVNAQGSFQDQTSVVTDIMSNLKSLHGGKDENSDAIANIQEEFYQIFYSGDYEALKDFSARLDRLTAQRKVQELK